MPCGWRPVSRPSTDPRVVRWRSVAPSALWEPVQRFFPPPPARVLEVGAGCGRDAAWFATLGYAVTCVEPDRSLWPEGADWFADPLPRLNGPSGRFDLITLSAVWHLLEQSDWAAALVRLRTLAAPGARLILSLRMPPLRGAPDIVQLARRTGWRALAVHRRPLQQAGNRAQGVLWDWCVLVRVAPG